MLMLKDRLPKMAVDNITYLLFFAALMPASAYDSEPKTDSSASVPVPQEESLPRHLLKNLPDETAAQIAIIENGKSKEVLVKPRSNLRAQTVTGQNVALETSAAADDEQAIAEEDTAAVEGDDSVKNRIPTRPLNSYNKLVTIYEKLLFRNSGYQPTS
jgi:hypothetical protein